MHRLEGNRLLAGGLIAAGVVALVLQRFGWRFDDTVWPMFVIVPGVALLVLSYVFTKEAKVLAVAGAITTGTGLILFFQNLTDYFQSWAYLWPLMPVFAGLGFAFVGQRDGDAQASKTGRGLLLSGAVMLAVFATVFEGLIFHGIPIASDLVLPAVLIALGVGVFLRGLLPKPGRTDASTASKEMGSGPTAAARH